MKLHFAVILLLLLNDSFGQVKFEAYQGYPIKTMEEDKHVLPLGSKGAVLFGNMDLERDGEDNYEFIFYDAQLQVVKQQTVPINKKFEIKSTCKSGDDVYVLFAAKNEYSFLHIGSSFSIKQIDGTFPDKSSPESCHVMDTKVYFTQGDAVIKLDLITEKVSIKYYADELSNVKKPVITKFQVFPERNEYLVFFASSTSKMISDVLRLNSDGEVLSKYDVSEGLGYNAATISAGVMGEKDYVFSGAYASGSNSDPEGLFFLGFNGEQVASKKTYNFLDLDSLNHTFYKLSYFNQKMIERRYNKQLKAKEANATYAYPLLSATHDLIKNDNNYLLINELFELYYLKDIKNQAYKKAGVVQFATMALLMNKEGDMIWNKSFATPGDFFSPTERLMSKIKVDSDQVRIGKSHREGIFFATLSLDNGKISGIANEEKALKSENEVHFKNLMFNGYPGEIDFWYGNTWLAYGRERLQRKDGGSFLWKEFRLHKVNYSQQE